MNLRQIDPRRDRVELLRRTKGLSWYHRIDIGDGEFTPGLPFEPLWEMIRHYRSHVDYTGKSVIDIGTWDGGWAFEAEDMGASKVVASDILSLRPVSGNGPETFQLAKELRKSKATFLEASIYNVDEKTHGQKFDIVQCFGVVYHLRYPQLGLAKLRRVTAPDGLLLLETAVVLDSEESHIRTGFENIYPSDVTTFNAFTMPALERVLVESYFEVVEKAVLIRQDEDRKIGRGYFLCRAFEGPNMFHYFPYPELERFHA